MNSKLRQKLIFHAAFLSVLCTATYNAAAQPNFGADVWPILAARCIECHGPEKQKEGVRFDTPEWTGYKDLLPPGEPDESLIVELISLPADHEDRMPSEGEPLTEAEIATIRDWIAAGGDLAGFDWEAAAAELLANDPRQNDPLIKLAADTPAPDMTALAAVNEQGALALPLAQDTPLVSVDYHLQGKAVDDAALAALTPLAQQLTWLNLAGTGVTDAGMAQLEQFPKLTRLHLENTTVGDAGLAHLAKLEHLQYVNLYGTAVTDAGLAHLHQLPNLQKVYLWQTGVTEEGVKALRAAQPDLQINTGLEVAAFVEPVEEATPTEDAAAADTANAQAAPAFPLALFFSADSCCAKAFAAGLACSHPCCAEAFAANTVCTKCNPGADAKQTLAAKFTEGSCCTTAAAQGKWCDHPCCAEAIAANTVCTKCNAPAADAAETDATEGANDAAPELAAKFTEGSCCATAAAAGDACTHPCCVEAATKGEVCTKCNPPA